VRRLTNRVAISILVLAVLAVVITLVGLGGRGEVAAAVPEWSPTPEIRRFGVDYEVEIAARPSGDGTLHLFVPIASDTSGQRILDVEIESDLVGRIQYEKTYGNRFWHAVVAADRIEAISFRVTYEVERRVLHSGDERGDAKSAEQFLASNERVVVGHPVLTPILAEIHAESDGEEKADTARAIYDWVVDNVEYKKIGTGWGNGDTFWACNERYGNCTDFHSLFISLARTEGIPARFEMGFPIPADRKEGTVLGYHCWVEFWLPEHGWFPIDASEAFKNPDQRELFYGTHPADRLHFTTGRDLRLGNDHRDRPLNYFIYPYVEIDGKRSDIEIKTRLDFWDRMASSDS
jgi:transglutaminase-like putative cysteine protease